MANTGQRFGCSTETVNIATDLSAKANYLVTRGANNTVALAVTATAPCFILLEGVTGTAPNTVGTIAKVGQAGSIALVKIGGNVTGGDKLTSDGSGLAITTTTSGNYYFGVATESGVANDIIPVDISINGSVT
jgi:hypothetical protein